MKLINFTIGAFKRYFLIGLIVLLPFAVAFNFILFIIRHLDAVLESDRGRFLYILPDSLHPDNILGFHIPGLGIIFLLVIILLTGVLSRNFFGKKLIEWSEALFARIPVIRLIYNAVKEIILTYVRRDKSRFSKVVMIEYPRRGLYTLAFVTGVAVGEIQRKTKEKVINLFVPTTPNPTSGFYIMIPEAEAIVLDLTIEDAFKLIVSGGMVSPEHLNAEPANHAAKR